MRNNRKLLVLQTHPIQYYAPLYKALSALENLDVVVVYLTDKGVRPYFDAGFGKLLAWDVDLLEGYRHRFLQPGIGMKAGGLRYQLSSSLWTILREESPDAILLRGYNSPMNWLALLFAKWRHAKLLYASDSNDRIRSRGLKHIAKNVIVRAFLRKMDWMLTCSDANRDYLLRYGAPAEKLAWVPLAIDVSRFRAPGAQQGRMDEVDVCWAGKLVDIKRPLDFVEALARLRARGLKVKGRLIGDGPLRPRVEAAANSLLQSGTLEITGFVNQASMPTFLRAAKVFAFTCEHESYGLGATEAAACGLAIVAADTIGCVGEHGSAQPGVNALTYPVGNVGALVDRLEELLTHPVRLAEMRSASLRVAAKHDTAIAAACIHALVSLGSPGC